jgi:transposase InsO family protein
MAARYIGEILPFTEGVNWDVYIEQVAIFWQANGIDEDDKKRAVLLTSIGSVAYGVVKSLTAPALPIDTGLTELLKLLKDHYSPRPNPIVCRREFYKRDRRSGEKVAVYLAELRRLADYCDFGAYLDTALRDMLFMGIEDSRIQRRLSEISYKELTLTKTISIALAMEAAEQTVATLQEGQSQYKSSTANATTVNLVPQHDNNSKGQRFASYSSNKEQCWRCGNSNHTPARCKFKTVECYSCGREGHIERMCRQKKKDGGDKRRHKQRVHQVDEEEDELEEDFGERVHIHAVTDTSSVNTISSSVPPFTRYVMVYGQKVTLEVDSGCGVTLINKATFEAIKRRRPILALRKPDTDLCTYTKSIIPALGQVTLPVQYRGKRRQLTAYVVDGQGPNLLGRNWMGELGIYLSQVNAVKDSMPAPEDLKAVLRQFPVVFEQGLGKYNGPLVHLEVSESAIPKFCKARPVPFALRDKVEAEIDRLVKEGIYVPVPYSKWATPLVPVLKPNGQVRLCGDYKCTVNQAINREIYPMPTVEEMFSKLAGSALFCKIDLSQAFQQLILDEVSQELVTVNTSKGLFRVTRLVYGISSSPAIFQREMDNLLSGIPGVVYFIDDVLISASTTEQLKERLHETLARLARAGLRAQREKCVFGQTEVTYLGYQIDKDGLHPTDDKVSAILSAPEPTNVTQLRQFIGLIMYYARFIENHAQLLGPLYDLLHQDTTWRWGEREKQAYEGAKAAVTNNSVLAHFDPNLPIVVACDASPDGVAGCLSHKINGEEKPVMFISRRLTPAERGYSQLQREALSIVFTVTRLRQFLLGRRFTIFTDNQPITSLFSPDKQLPSVAAARVLRWSITLSSYDYVIKHRKATLHANVDTVSRLLPTNSTEPSEWENPQESVLYLMEEEDMPVREDKLRQQTARDPLLTRIIDYLRNDSWPTKLDETLLAYFKKRHELSCDRGLLLWGGRVVVPSPFQQHVLEELHAGHIGSTHMKQLARSYVYWYNIDDDIERKVATCVTCQHNAHMPPSEAIRPWPHANIWSRLHIDFCGPVDGYMIMVMVDAGSKYLDAVPMRSANTTETIRALRTLMATHGLVVTVVSDNGSVFKSQEFEEFLKKNGINHLCTPPYSPCSNGLCERMVQVVKTGLKKIKRGDIYKRLAEVLLTHRRTPLATMGNMSPAELLFNRRIIACSSAVCDLCCTLLTD